MISILNLIIVSLFSVTFAVKPWQSRPQSGWGPPEQQWKPPQYESDSVPFPERCPSELAIKL